MQCKGYQKMAEIIWSEEAILDLEDIHDYIAPHSSFYNPKNRSQFNN